MKYGEYWILESALEFYIPLYLIAWPRRFLEAHRNKPWHGLQQSELVDAFEQLVGSGDVVLRDDNWDVVHLSRSELNAEFEARKAHEGQIAYGLTPNGGFRWEQFSKADWSRFHSWEWDDSAEDILEIAATTREVAERAFRYIGPWNEFRMFPETVERRALQPWSATYWKTLDIGHSVRFKCEYFDDYNQLISHYFPRLSDAQIREALSEIRQDYDYFTHWYSKHPDTPVIGAI